MLEDVDEERKDMEGVPTPESVELAPLLLLLGEVDSRRARSSTEGVVPFKNVSPLI